MNLSVDNLIARVPQPRARKGLELIRDTIRDAIEDRVTGLAAEIAFWSLLSLPPLLLVIAAASGFVGEAVGADVRTDLINRIASAAGAIFEESTVERTIQPLLDSLLTQGSPSLLSFGFLLTIYSASRALRVVIHALGIAYDLEDRRPSWQSRLLGILYLIASLPAIGIILPLVVAGPGLGQQLVDALHLPMLIATLWRILYWPGAFVLLAGFVTLLYHRGAPWWTPFRRDVPGALLATSLGLLASVGLRTYTSRAFGGDAVYAPLAAPLAVLFWLWLQGIALLIGAEFNAEIERHWPTIEPADDSGRPMRRLSRRARSAAHAMRTRAEEQRARHRAG